MLQAVRVLRVAALSDGTVEEHVAHHARYILICALLGDLPAQADGFQLDSQVHERKG